MKPLSSFPEKKGLYLFMREIFLNLKRLETFYWNKKTEDMAFLFFEPKYRILLTLGISKMQHPLFGNAMSET